ncbi:hypothetical protein CDAR_54711 [Caerostris darwini]|uniref:Uncharacterized protein n=1 Tax=Caerostris darwini TaxID=1538125 RepID=A0AAV4S3Z5_9ARAC|nr:hypothetical protein CDAR_54711 [Caerostris darwini]
MKTRQRGGMVDGGDVDERRRTSQLDMQSNGMAFLGHKSAGDDYKSLSPCHHLQSSLRKFTFQHSSGTSHPPPSKSTNTAVPPPRLRE